jgi:hypothetical protein
MARGLLYFMAYGRKNLEAVLNSEVTEFGASRRWAREQEDGPKNPEKRVKEPTKTA